METSKKNSLGGKAQQFFLRWSAAYDSTFREEIVDFINHIHSEWIFRSDVLISERTPVYLTGSSYMGNGIIQSCRQEGPSFILTIDMTNENIYLAPRQQFDPGVMHVDNFLTEEDEAKILDSLADELEIPCSAVMRGLSAPIRLIQAMIRRLALMRRRFLLQSLTVL